MVPNVTKGSASFKGAAAYYVHDKEAETAERVVWTETVNLVTSDPEKATRVMAATAMAQNELKIALEMNPRNVDAQRELRLINMRSTKPKEKEGKGIGGMLGGLLKR